MGSLPASDEPSDLIVIGAGVYGIAAATTYLTLHPTRKILIIDGDSNVGGVWGSSRLYPHFWSQTGTRVSGYPDVPFNIPETAERYYDLFESKYLATYLEDYVSGKIFDGQAFKDRFLFGCWVGNVQKRAEVWKVDAQMKETAVAKVFTARKIIVATGRYSIPKMPDFKNKNAFKGPIIHQKDFGRSGILSPQEPNLAQHEHITVVGGSKSASDIVYAAAIDSNASRKVSWIIRDTNTGPLILTHPKPPSTKYRNLPETGSTRALAALSSANPFLKENLWSWFLHKTFLGDALLEKMFQGAEQGAKRTANFKRREGALEGFQGLESSVSLRWRTGSIGVLQMEDYWDVVAKRVKVYRGEIDKLTEAGVVLRDGREVASDVLLCATGWKPEMPFFSVEEKARLGLPLGQEEVEVEEKKLWAKLDEEADRSVLARWPYLARAPAPVHSKMSPFKLYNMMTPIHDHSIAFLGTVAVPNSYHTSLAQSLYAIAILDGVITLPTTAKMEKNVAFMNAWCKRRYPSSGHEGHIMDYEMVSHTDYLLSELGLSSHRDGRSWWADLTEPTLASDYVGLVGEYRKKYVIGED